MNDIYHYMYISIFSKKEKKEKKNVLEDNSKK